MEPVGDNNAAAITDHEADPAWGGVIRFRHPQAARRIVHTLDAAIWSPSRLNSPWLQRYPQLAFFAARRMISRRISGSIGGRARYRSWWLGPAAGQVGVGTHDPDFESQGRGGTASRRRTSPIWFAQASMSAQSR